MKYKRLGKTDMMVSQIGFGASVFNNFYLDTLKFDNSSDSLQRVRNLIDKVFRVGINYFDVAPWYGNAQYLLAHGLQDRERTSYYLATKVGRYNCEKPPQEWFDFSYKKTIESVEESLEIFKCNYIDLIQIHDIEFIDNLNIILNETLPALNELKANGKVRYIGINSYSLEKLKELVQRSLIKIDTILTFTHLTLDDTSLLDYVEFFQSKQIGIINASPLSMGLYSDKGAPGWHRAPEKVKNAVKLASDYCNTKNVSLAKLAIHFSSTNPLIDTTIVSMASEQYVFDNVEALNKLNENEKQVLEYIRNKIFIPLDYKGYGNIEVDCFKKNLDFEFFKR